MNGVERSKDGVKYKGIDLKKIKQVQKIRFSHVHVDPEEVKLALNHITLNDNMTAAQMALQDKIKAHQRKYMEDHDMFIICEIAKLFLEEKEKQKNVIGRLEEELKLAEKDMQECTYKGMPFYDKANGYATAMYNAIEIIKEEMM